MKVRTISDDNTKQEIEYNAKVYGYSEIEPLELNFSLKHLSREIHNDKTIILPRINLFKFYSINIKKIKAIYKLYKELGIDLHVIDLSSFSYPDGEIIIDEKFLNSLRYDVLPSEIPITFNNNINSDIEIFSMVNEDNQIGLLFKKIILPKYTNEFASAQYFKQLATTQLKTSYGCIKNILNSNTIQEFMSEVCAKEIDKTDKTLTEIRNCKLDNLVNFIDITYEYSNLCYRDKVKIHTEIKSILQSIALSNMYFSSNNERKKEILSYINQIFNQKKTVEDMLYHFETDFYDFSKDLENLKIKKKVF